MKSSLKLPQFKISVRDENRSEFLDDIWVIYVGDYPSGVGKENLIPINLQEAIDLSDLHGMFTFDYTSKFYIEIDSMMGAPETDGIILGVDLSNTVIQFSLPKSSIFRVTKLSTMCDHHLWDWYELKEATKEIRQVYPMELQD